nr:ParB/RepB/Spo0J family partition protein [Burkholderiaceae bacterium]
MTIARVSVSDIRPDPKQPRSHFNEAALKTLSTSIKKVGQRQPITVRPLRVGAKVPYEIVDGERRWRACKLAGIQTIRVDVEDRDLSRHADQHLLSLTSNFMREGHTHSEISVAVQYQVEAAIEAGMSRGRAVQELVESIGKSEAWVYQYLQLQQLCSELQDM